MPVMHCKPYQMNRSIEKISLIILLGLLGSGIINGQDLTVKLGLKVILESEILKENRSIIIHLPDNYKDSYKSYPVLFRLDGDTEMILETVAVVNRLTYSDEISPEMIIVAIENTNRDKDMWPCNTEYYPKPNKPGAKEFLSFIEKELIPYIEDNYQTSQEKIICGQSISAVFVLYSLLVKPEIFDSYIACSGGFPACEEYFKALYDSAFQQSEKFLEKKVFISNGLKDPLDPEGKIHHQILDFSNAISEDIGSSILYKYSVYQDEGHVPFHSLYDGLKFIFEANN
jgi:predicted alpha/beta superfamily hydrolase